VTFSGFYGSGSITVMAEADGDAVFKTMVKLEQCSIPVTFQNIRFQDYDPKGNTSGRSGIWVDEGSRCYVDGCTFTSTNGGTAHHLGYAAFSVSGNSVVSAYNMRGIYGCACAALVSGSGIVSCACNAEDTANFHDNAHGVVTYQGGIALLGGSMPDTMGGAANNHVNGGLIVAANGTVLTA